MADQVKVTGAQITALAEKLEGMRGSFSADEQAALDAVFALAGRGLEADAEVQGFAVDMFHQGDQFSLNFTRPGGDGTQGILIGLLKNGGSAAGSPAGTMGWDVKKNQKV